MGYATYRKLFSEAETASRIRSMAGQLFEERKLRASSLPPEMLGEFAWDCLLLLVQHKHGLCETAMAAEINAPASVIRRWLDYLKEQGLCETNSGVAENRVFKLSSTGRTLMTTYIESIRDVSVTPCETIMSALRPAG